MSKENKSFRARCYRVLSQVPEGKVTTYREIAAALHSRASRAVGSAMAKNERLIEIPCHRVVRSDGTIGQYALGPEKKAELLLKEGVQVKNGKVLNFRMHLHRFSI